VASLMKYLNQIFFKGLIVVLPITLTFYLLIWASINVESIFGSGLSILLGQKIYFPGLGIIVTIIFIFLVGLLVNNYFTGRFFGWLTQLLEKVPLIKAIYNPLKDLMALIPGRNSDKNKPQNVVLVNFDHLGVEALGLVTREDLEELKTAGENKVSVYIPFSYMLGGMTVIVSKDKIRKVDIPVDQALKLSVTAWIKANEEKRD
jgi:uncharacterized membrane protein